MPHLGVVKSASTLLKDKLRAYYKFLRAYLMKNLFESDSIQLADRKELLGVLLNERLS